MIRTDDKYLLMIEPLGPPEGPIDDELTELARRVFALAEPRHRTRGQHRCDCGERSDNAIWILPDGRETNSLLVHYVACHRSEVPAEEIAKLQEYD